MELIKECCNDNSRNKYSIIQHRKNINELQELFKEGAIKKLDPNELKMIQIYEREQNDIIEYLERKIEKNKTCCQMVKKILFHQ